MRRIGVALVALVALAGCGGDTEPGAAPTSAPPVTTPAATMPALTDDPGVLGSMLKDVATAQEAYASEEMKYTTRLSDLVDQGLEPDPQVRIKLVSATKTRYCVSAAGAAGLVYYYDSDIGQPSRTPCR